MSSFALIEDFFYLGLVNFVEEMARVRAESPPIARPTNSASWSSIVSSAAVANAECLIEYRRSILGSTRTRAFLRYGRFL